MRRHLHGHRAGAASAEHLRDEVLHLARVLGGAVDEHGAALAGHRQRHLAFQVEVLLAADARAVPTGGAAPGRWPPRRAAPQHLRRQHERPGASASSMVRMAGRSSYSTVARKAASRACSRVSAATAKSDWPQYSTSPSAKTLSPGSTGPMSFSPGSSRAVITAATPGEVRTALTSSRVTRACARSREAHEGVQEVARLGQVVEVDAPRPSRAARRCRGRAARAPRPPPGLRPAGRAHAPSSSDEDARHGGEAGRSGAVSSWNFRSRFRATSRR